MIRSLPVSAPRFRLAARQAAAIALGVALLTLCAKVRVPSWPVPMTLQTFAVMTLAVAAGPRLAGATFLAYLGAGAAGWPVFSGTPERGIGLAYIAGPTGGYLLGFLAACWITGTLARGRGPAGRIAAMLAGLAAIYAAGLSWLALHVPADRLVPLGLAPFLLSDLVAIATVAAATALAPAGRLGRDGR
ncbi:MAG: biotin transporter BioY [Methylobacterium frigidaeris]